MSCQHLRINDLDKASKQEKKKKGTGDNDERKNIYISNVFRDIGEVLNDT